MCILTHCYNGTINKAIVTVKGNGFDTSTDGQFTISLYKNQANYDSTAYTQTVNIDDFSEKVSNMNAGTVDCNQKVFSSINVSIKLSRLFIAIQGQCAQLIHVAPFPPVGASISIFSGAAFCIL